MLTPPPSLKVHLDFRSLSQLNLVALNQPHSGDMMGLDMADRMCYEQAKAMGLPPHYRAFISSHRQDLVHVVSPGFRDTLPVTNLRVSRISLLFATLLLLAVFNLSHLASGGCDV